MSGRWGKEMRRERKKEVGLMFRRDNRGNKPAEKPSKYSCEGRKWWSDAAE